MSPIIIRRRRRSRLERVLSGLLHIGKYSMPSVLLTLAGCVPPPNLIGVSPDGRYLVLPANSAGVAVMIEDEASIVRLDLKTNEVQSLGPNRKAAFWMNVAGDSVAYCVLGDAAAENSIGAAVVLLHGNESPVTIPNAIFPALSPDGAKLVYTAISETFQDTPTGKLMVRDTKTGKTTELAAQGVAPEFSPDGKRLVFVAKKDDHWTADVIDVDGKNRKSIGPMNADAGGIFKPRWLDKDSIIYRSITDATGSDGELMIGTLDGKSQPLTSNELADVLPVVAGKDRVVWQGTTATDKIGQEMLPLWVSERKDGKWTSRELGVKALAFAVVGDDLVYATFNEGAKKIQLLRCPIADTTKTTDLSAVIAEKAKGLPASKINAN